MHVCPKRRFGRVDSEHLLLDDNPLKFRRSIPTFAPSWNLPSFSTFGCSLDLPRWFDSGRLLDSVDRRPQIEACRLRRQTPGLSTCVHALVVFYSTSLPSCSIPFVLFRVYHRAYVALACANLFAQVPPCTPVEPHLHVGSNVAMLRLHMLTPRVKLGCPPLRLCSLMFFICRERHLETQIENLKLKCSQAEDAKYNIALERNKLQTQVRS